MEKTKRAKFQYPLPCGSDSRSFAFVYIYELLNQIGVQSAEDGYKKLQDFCRRYGELDSGIKRYLRIWMSDYAVYYGLDRSLFDNTPESEFEQRVLTLLDYKSRTRDEIFEAVNGLSSYNITNSKLYKAYPEETRLAAAAAFAALAGYYEKNRKRIGYNPLLAHDYSQEKPSFREVSEGHFVLCNQTEFDEYREEINR